ncbi:MAG: nitrous oxide-stimulated promoter family protein [Anaerolineaceae bacterium]
MNHDSVRMRRESQTVDSMIRLYCRLLHETVAGLCAECANLQEYTRECLDRCPFAPDKPTCAKCLVHCYKAERREQLRVVMRFAGPRMIFFHPVMAIRHLLDERKKAPVFGRK